MRFFESELSVIIGRLEVEKWLGRVWSIELRVIKVMLL